LELKNVRATYGILGQERKDNTVLPGDIYVLSFDIEGLQVAKGDVIRYSIGVEFINKDGKTEFKQDPVPQEVTPTLGGNRVPAYANVTVGKDVTPGEYTVRVTVSDQTANKTQKLEQKFEVQSLRFGLVRVGFAYPVALPPPPAPPVGVVGQALIFQATAVEVGLSDKTKNPDLLAEVNIVDEAGKPTLSQPLQGKVQDISEEFRRLRVIPMSFAIQVNRPGKFKVTMAVTDKITGKKAEQTLDLTAIEHK
jgi:hypothetical protein